MLFEKLTHIDDLMEDCNISSALAMEILQSCTKQNCLSILPFYYECLEVNSTVLKLNERTLQNTGIVYVLVW